MDAREGHSQNKCGMCGQKGHNRKMCQNRQHMWIGETTLQVPLATPQDGAIDRCCSNCVFSLNLTKYYVIFLYV